MNKQLLERIEIAKFVDLIDIALDVEALIGRQHQAKAGVIFDNLVEGAKACIENEYELESQIQLVLEYFYTESLFSETANHRLSTRSACIGYALNYRTANVITLGTILLALFEHLGVEVEAIFVPGEVIIKVNLDETAAVYISPAAGTTLSADDLAMYLQSYQESLEFISYVSGDTQTMQSTQTLQAQLPVQMTPPWPTHAYVDKADLQIQAAESNDPHWHEANGRDVIVLYLTQLKTLLIANGRFEKAYIVVELLLALQPDDPYERRDRGFMLQKMHCHEMAEADLNFFVEQCPHDPTCEVIKQQLEVTNRVHLTFH